MIKPGIHLDMPNEVYHADAEYLSSTTLKRALPERYKAGGSQDALDFGTLFHTVVLEPDKLDDYLVLDAHAIAGNNPKTGKPYDKPEMTARFKAAREEAKSSGRSIVSQDDWDRAHDMRNAVMAHAEASSLLVHIKGQSEVSAFWRDEHGVGHKARYDRLLDGIAVDLKSTSAKPGVDSLSRTVVDYGYDLSAAHYLAVADGLELGVETFAFVFVGKEPPHRVNVCDLSDEFLFRGQVLRALAIERRTNPAAEPYEGARGTHTLPLPRWARINEGDAA